MKTYVLTDYYDMLVGFRLAGIEGEFVKTENALEVMKEKMKDKNLGALIITRSILKAHEEEILELKLKSKHVMITAVPIANEVFENDLAKYIRDSIGIKL